MSTTTTHVFRVQDVYARLRVNVALESPAVSPSSKESGSKSGTGTPCPSMASATRSNIPHDPHLQASFAKACNNQQVVAQSTWQCPITPSPLPLDLVYGPWSADEEESGIVLSLESSFDGDIFGVGKRPVQYEIEKDGCIQLVFAEE